MEQAYTLPFASCTADTAVLLTLGLFLFLWMVIWQSVQLHEQQQWNAQRQSQQIHIHERMEIAASQAERVEVWRTGFRICVTNWLLWKRTPRKKQPLSKIFCTTSNRSTL